MTRGEPEIEGDPTTTGKGLAVVSSAYLPKDV